ncbi:MAG: hypothetical protein ACP5HW_01060 [Candidatus Micrarchaeia archaeon]
MGSFGKLFFKEKQVKAFLILAENSQEWNLSNLAKASGATYVHISRFINACEGAGLIESTKHGRIKGIKLTQKGVEVAGHLSNISSSIERLDKEKEKEKEKQEPKQEKQELKQPQ